MRVQHSAFTPCRSSWCISCFSFLTAFTATEQDIRLQIWDPSDGELFVRKGRHGAARESGQAIPQNDTNLCRPKEPARTARQNIVPTRDHIRGFD